MKRHFGPVRSELSKEFARDDFLKLRTKLKQELREAVNASRAARGLPPTNEGRHLTGDMETDFPGIGEYLRQQAPEG